MTCSSSTLRHLRVLLVVGCVYIPIPVILFAMHPIHVETMAFEGVALVFYLTVSLFDRLERTLLAAEGFIWLATISVFHTRAVSYYLGGEDPTQARDFFLLAANATLLSYLLVWLSADAGAEPSTTVCTRWLGNKYVRWTLGPVLCAAGGAGGVLSLQFLWPSCWEFITVAAVIWGWITTPCRAVVPLLLPLLAGNMQFMLRLLLRSLDNASYYHVELERPVWIGLVLMVVANFLLILLTPYPQIKAKSYFTALPLSCGAFVGFAGLVIGSTGDLISLWWELGFGVFVFLFIAAVGPTFRAQAIVFVSIATVYPGIRLFAWLDGGLDTKIGIGSLVTVVSHLLLIGALGFEKREVPVLSILQSEGYAEPAGTRQSTPLHSPDTLTMIRIVAGQPR